MADVSPSDYVATGYAKQLAEDREEQKQKKQAEDPVSPAGSSTASVGGEEDDCTQPLLTRVQKLGDKALTNRIRSLVAMEDVAINKITTDQGRKMVRDFLQGLIRKFCELWAVLFAS